MIHGRDKLNIILDTSVLISNIFADLDHGLGLSIISVAELEFGISVAKTQQIALERSKRLKIILKLFKPILINEEIAANYGKLASIVK